MLYIFEHLWRHRMTSRIVLRFHGFTLVKSAPPPPGKFSSTALCPRYPINEFAIHHLLHHSIVKYMSYDCILSFIVNCYYFRWSMRLWQQTRWKHPHFGANWYWRWRIYPSLNDLPFVGFSPQNVQCFYWIVYGLYRLLFYRSPKLLHLPDILQALLRNRGTKHSHAP